VRKPRLRSIRVQLPLIFIVVGFIAPTIGITYIYVISSTALADSPTTIQHIKLLEAAAIIIIILITINAGILGHIITSSYTRPLKEIQRATTELEKGNFNVRINLTGEDEFATLSDTFNHSAQALAAMEEERRRLDQAKSEFLSITSHELRTPITPLKAQIQMLLHEYFGPLTEKQRASLDIVLRNAERLDRIIEDFLEVSRIESARLKFAFKPNDPKDIIRETVGLMQGFAEEKHIKINTETGELPIIELDPDRVCQVLRNLLHNAVKFSQDNGIITVRADQREGFIQFSIEDHGVGLSDEDQVRVFEPFYQVEKSVNRKYGGTGLGLTICRGIVESQNGKIWVESKLGVGSTFHFTIPLTPVRDIQPIKVLFSQKTEIEARLREEFTSMLGPMGNVEFTELKQKHSLGRDDLFAYITSLERMCILRHDTADTFRTNIQKIFGEETRQPLPPASPGIQQRGIP
jgi:signal transduction histidine kinase